MATILIVDDHPINRQFLRTLLGYEGHVLFEAAEGASALNIVLTEHLDLVITDILMPNMDGYEFITHMRAHPSVAKVPVIFYTASYRAREARSMAEACGVQWVLSKPSEPGLILQTVHEALGDAPSAADSAGPHLSASLEADKFSAINDQLREFLAHLNADGKLLTLATGDSAELEEKRVSLRSIAEKLTGSVGSLQQVSLRLTRLVELGLDLAAERDPARMLEILCRAAHGICGASHAAVAVLSEDGQVLEHCYVRGMSSDVCSGIRELTPHAGVLGKLIKDRVPCRMNGLKGDPAVIGLPPTHPQVHSFLGVPIASKERTYGWLYVANRLDGGEFTEVDEQVAATIAAQMAAAYENLILYEEVHQHSAQLQMEVIERKQAQDALRRNLRARTVMADCNRVLMHAENEIALLNETCLTIAESGGYPMVWMGYVSDDADGTIKVVARAGLPPHEQDQPAGGWRDEAEGGAARKALATDAALAADAETISAAASNPAFAQWKNRVATLGYRSVLTLPLKDHATIFGALSIFENAHGGFTGEQVEMLEELAADIAYCVVNLRTRRARDKAEQSLVATQEKLNSILSSIDNIVWSVSDHEFIYINPVAEEVFGYPLAEFYKNRELWASSIHPDDRAGARATMERLRIDGAVKLEYRIVRKDGSLRWLEERTRAVHDQEGRLLRFDGVASDITERKQYEVRVEHLATHDPLTGLANRNLLQDRLAQAMAATRRTDRSLALVFVDLDRFKDINDTLGHAVGDGLLIGVSQRLQAAVREGDTVARPGGDEFIVLLTDLSDAEDVLRIARKLLDAFSAPFEIGDLRQHCTASIGISVYPQHGNDIETLLKNTDTAMYNVKERGGDGIQLYSAEMNANAMERLALENALHLAVEHREFELYYQPKVNLVSGEITGAEALIRWHHPNLGMLLPGEFIPLAEEVGLITSIGDWVLKFSCVQNKLWQEDGLPPICVSVNLSARQFRHADLVKSVARALADVGLDARYLELELTEGMVMHNAELFVNKLLELKALGLRISLDDFGTGYSSLSHLKRFPLNHLKIDQSFVRDIATNPDDAAIARTVIALGHSLNLKVIAEGVETAGQLAFLREHHCDEIQGFYFSEPLPADEFAELLRSGKKLEGY
ncbi:hypothetical protein BH11PSE11_BH11PSE11_31780 [soil metagenome]